MDTLMQSQVFFFISSVGFVTLWILLAVFLVYLIRLIKSFTKVMEKVEQDVNNISESTRELLLNMQESMLWRFIFGKKRKPARNAKA